MARSVLIVPVIAVMLLTSCASGRDEPNPVQSGFAVCDHPGVLQTQGGGPPVDPGLPTLESVELTAESGVLRVDWHYDRVAPPAPAMTTILRYIRVFANREAFTKGAAEAFTLEIEERGPGVGGDVSEPPGWSVQTSTFDTKAKPTGTEPRVEGSTISATFPAESLSRLRQPFWWYAQEDVVQVSLTDAGGSSRLCPGNTSETRLVPDEPLVFPGAVGQKSVASEPDPTSEVASELTTTSEAAKTSVPSTLSSPSTSLAAPPPSTLSESQAADGLVRAWNESDPGAAAYFAADDAVRFMFSEPTNRDAKVTRCRHYSQIPESEYQAFGTFVCDGTFTSEEIEGMQTFELYIDGGLSAGYSVSAVSFNKNPPGWRPVD